jgi:putative two-component system response regulator
MSYYSELIARALRLPAAECELIREAARLHDIGKIGTPDHILLKVGAFTPAEAEVMKAHTTMGHAILAGSRSPILRAGADIALCHHERYDGSGYPRAIAADAIPLHSRIVAVADVFDALTTLRRYKGAWDVERAGRYIREGSGSQFDPACVDAFLASWPEVLVIKARYSEITPPPGVTAEMPVHTLAVTELPAPSLRS